MRRSYLPRRLVRLCSCISAGTIHLILNLGGHYCYGLRVCPLLTDNQSCTSTGSNREYDVWRRWEDCLWFQELLEYEYELMARSKRGRLAAGKGVKKNGVYIHSDQAASFDSLPPGPDANSVAMDVHEIIPKLNKKATIFRPNQATIDQRGREFKTMIESLLDEDVPTLVQELRELRVVRDFFGVWRRDKDHARKDAEARTKASGGGRNSSRVSITSSTLSMYFSPSKGSLYDTHSDSDTNTSPSRGRSASEASFSTSSPRSIRSQRTPATAPVAFTVSEDGALMSPVEEHSEYRGGLRSAPVRSAPRWSTGASSIAPSECPSDASGVPIMFVSGDERIQARMTIDRHPGLQVLPEEEEELHEPTSRMTLAVPQYRGSPVGRPRGNSVPERGAYRDRCAVPNSPDVPESLARESTLTVDTHPYSPYVTASAVVVPRTSGPGSNSSKRSSVELSSFSDRSSWRTSATSIGSNPSSVPTGSTSEVDKAYYDNPVTPQTPHFRRESHMPRDSLATVDSFIASSIMESMLSHRSSPPLTPGRRSFSVGDRQSHLPSDGIPDEAWEDRDDLMATYFYGKLYTEYSFEIVLTIVFRSFASSCGRGSL